MEHRYKVATLLGYLRSNLVITHLKNYCCRMLSWRPSNWITTRSLRKTTCKVITKTRDTIKFHLCKCRIMESFNYHLWVLITCQLNIFQKVKTWLVIREMLNTQRFSSKIWLVIMLSRGAKKKLGWKILKKIKLNTLEFKKHTVLEGICRLISKKKPWPHLKVHRRIPGMVHF